MAYGETWNAAYEATPDGGEDRSLGDDRIRALKTSIRERLEKDHYMAIAGVDADHGEHKQITFHAPISTPGNVANKSILYEKDVSAKVELHYLDEDGNEVQITSAGSLKGQGGLDAPAGTKMYFYQNTAPAGWTIDAACADALLAIKGGADAFNVDGGNQAGTWTQPNHTHTGSDHSHELPIGKDGSNGIMAFEYTAAPTGGSHSMGYASAFGASSASRPRLKTFDGGAGATGNGATAATYRPLAQVGIICTKD